MLDSLMHRLHKHRFRSKLEKKESRTFFLYILPWLIGFALFTIVPMISSLIYSFQKISILDIDTGGVWIGLKNYREVFQDQLFLSSIKNTFVYAIVKTFLGLAFALLFALLINAKFWGNKAVRVLIYLPAIIPSVASILVWSQLFSKDFSLLNYFLSFFHISPIDWTDSANAMKSVILMGVWTSIGPNMLIILAALQGVNKEVLECADVEGAGPFRKLFRIILPSISPTLFFMSITGIIGGLQAYMEMQLLFSPSEGTMTMAWNVVLRAFSLNGNHTMGYACAMAWILFIIILIFTGIYFGVSKQLGMMGNNDE